MNGGNEKEKEDVYVPENKQNSGANERIVLEVKREEKVKVEKKKGCC